MGEIADYYDPHPEIDDPDEPLYAPLDDDDIPWPDGPDPIPTPVPLVDQPIPHINWLCTGVAAKNLAKKGAEPHVLPYGSKPSQGTSDASGRFMRGRCGGCRAETIWKKVTL